MTAPGRSGEVSSAFPSQRSKVVSNCGAMMLGEQVQRALQLLTHDAIFAVKQTISNIYRIETVVWGSSRR
jgi:hypothetical protein